MAHFWSLFNHLFLDFLGRICEKFSKSAVPVASLDRGQKLGSNCSSQVELETSRRKVIKRERKPLNMAFDIAKKVFFTELSNTVNFL